MSQIPRVGQKQSQGQLANTTRTSNIPGAAGRTVSVSRTTGTEVQPCPANRAPGPSGAPCSGASGIRPPSGLRPPGARMPQRSPRAQSATQTSSICPAASASRLQPPGAMGRPSGIQQPSGMSRLQPPSAGRPSAIAGPSRPSGLQPPRTIGRPGGIPGPSGRPSGLQPPKPCGAVKPPCPGTTVPADIVSAEAEASQKIAEKQLRKPGKRVIAKAIVTRLPVDPGTIDTPEGPQPVVMQTTLEQRVERDETGEKVTKNLGITNVDVCTGVHKKISMGIQQMNPKYARYGGKEVIEATSKVSATENYATVQQITSRAITTTVSEAADLTGADIAQLVEEEKEDVDNTLKMLPPDLTARPGRYKMKQRLQKLRLNSESVALLEQSIIQPTPTADEAQTDPSPEAMAKMMHTVEKGVPPQSTPDQVFHSLFSETSNEKYVKLSAVSQGPLQDVVVPTEMPREVHQEVVSEEMNKLTEKLGGISDAEEVPYTDIFTKVMDDAAKSPTKGKNKESEFPVIGDEKSLWVNADLQHLVNIVGAEPAEVLDPLDISALAEEDGRLEQEMAKGVQYYIDADPVQYMSRVQLRGTMPPSYFPGYIVALPEFVEVVRLARSPDEVFASAWKSVQPKYFEDDSMQSLLF